MAVINNAPVSESKIEQKIAALIVQHEKIEQQRADLQSQLSLSGRHLVASLHCQMDNVLKIALLTAAGQAACAQNWKSAFARYLGIDDRSVRQWANGERTIPGAIITELIPNLNDRLAPIRQTIMLINAAIVDNENDRS